jgi:hypothetical protein
MRVNELRIGNLIFFQGAGDVEPQVRKVTARFFAQIAGGRPESEMKNDEEISGYHAPIILTEVWLLVLGFRPYGNMGLYVNGTGNYQLEIIKTGMPAPYDVWQHNQRAYLKTTKYVHELQNLFFTNVGEDLPVNQEFPNC